MVKQTLSKGIACLIALGLLLGIGWAEKKPAQEPAQVEKPQAVAQSKVAGTKSESVKVTEDKEKMNISKKCACEKFIVDLDTREEICKKIPQLIKQLNCPRSFHRERAIILLSRSGDPRAVKPLVDAMLNDPDEGLRSFAASILGNFAYYAYYTKTDVSLKKSFEEHAIPTLRKVLKSKNNRGVRSNAAMTLYKLGEISIALPVLEELAKEEHVEVLHCFSKVTSEGKIIYDENAKAFYIKALKYEDDEVRTTASLHLAKMGEKEIVKPVAIDILENNKGTTYSDLRARSIAIHTLEEIADEESILVIRKGLEDKNSSVRNEAKQALRRLEGKK